MAVRINSKAKSHVKKRKIKYPFANEEGRYLTNRTRHYKILFFISLLLLLLLLLLFIQHLRGGNRNRERERHLNDDFDEMIAGIGAMRWWNATKCNEMQWNAMKCDEMRWNAMKWPLKHSFCFCCLVFVIFLRVFWIFRMAMNWSFQVVDEVWPHRSALSENYANFQRGLGHLSSIS